MAKRYFSMDGEFSGLNHRKNCILSIGMIEVFEKDGIFSPDYGRKFYVELKPTGEVDEESMKYNDLDIDVLNEYGSNEDNAIREINKYLSLNEGDTAILIGYCGVLDKIYLDQLYQNKGFDFSPFHYEIIEISSLAIGKLDLEWGFSEMELLEKLNIKDIENKHNALADAVLQAKTFCALMNGGD